MKKFLLGGSMFAALAASAPAMAADLPVKAPVMAPVVFSWTGFYVGANLGYSWGRGDTDFSVGMSGISTTQSFAFGHPGGPGIIPIGPATVVTLPSVTTLVSSRANLNGAIGGGQFGYNWQRGSFVYGIETDLQTTGERGDTAICITAGCPTGGIFGSASYKLPWLATLRARLGVTVTPRVLLYATGGFAAAKVDSAFSAGLGGPVTSMKPNPTKAGFTAGAGVEGAIDSNWSAKIEALYVDLGSYDTTFPRVTNTTDTTVRLDPLAQVVTLNSTTTTTSGSFHSHVSDFIVRAGLNYRFGGPIVAKY